MLTHQNVTSDHNTNWTTLLITEEWTTDQQTIICKLSDQQINNNQLLSHTMLLTMNLKN